MSNFEKKFGKYAIPNISLVLILCYVAGYIITLVNPAFMNYLTLDPYKILHGQVWRIVTWIIQPPQSLDFFTILMLLFYYSIGTSLERTWGTYRYNVYLLGGMLFTVAASLLCLGVFWLLAGSDAGGQIPALCEFGAPLYSTYYINMSIFLAYAATFPDHQVLLMFVIPIKVKWLGIVYAVLLVVDMGRYYAFTSVAPYMWFAIAAIGASLLNFAIFWLRSWNLTYLRPKEVKRRAEFKQKVRQGNGGHVHKCAICGRTSDSDPMLEFRYCSKCKGSYEYCQEHLFTHEHVK